MNEMFCSKDIFAGMTQYEQVETLQRFKTGDVKILFTTSVGEEGIDIAECNLTIRYNHVGNEVTTVQTRGTSGRLLSFFAVWNCTLFDWLCLVCGCFGSMYVAFRKVLSSEQEEEEDQKKF